jgi:hypothetical protein
LTTSPAAAVTLVGSKVSYDRKINQRKRPFRRTMTYPTIRANLDSDVNGLDSDSGKESSDSNGATHFQDL